MQALSLKAPCSLKGAGPQGPFPVPICTTTARQHRCLVTAASCQAQPVPMHAVHRRNILALGGMSGLALLGGLSTPLPAPAALVDEQEAAKVYTDCGGSVVSVILYKSEKGTDVYAGVGSGFLFDNLGHVVTNYHVISRLDKSSDIIKVKFLSSSDSSPSLVPARLVASDTMNDLAVLRVDPAELAGAGFRPAPLGTSADLKIGQSVFAIGAPYGLSGTLSAGVLSGLNRSIPSPVGTRIYGVIQTDAAINAGNSGGPLLDSSGRVIGVNTATFTRSGTGRGSGVNFALPIDSVRDIVPKLIVYGNAMGKRV